MTIWKDHERRLVRLVTRGAGRVVGRAATIAGARRPVAWLHDEFFAAMADEIAARGVKQRVAAGMFGVSHRTFQRRLDAVRAVPMGSTLWWEIHEALVGRAMRREELHLAFASHAVEVVSSIVYDMKESGWLVEEEGVLTVETSSEFWDRARIVSIAGAMEMLDRPVSVEQLAAASGIPVDEVNLWLSETYPLSVDSGSDESRWTLIAAFIEHALQVAYRDLEDEPGTAASIWVVHYALNDRARQELERLRGAVAAARASLRDQFLEIVGSAEPTQDATTHAYSFVLSALEHTPTSWGDD